MTTDLATTNAVIVGVPMMDEHEARATITRIKTRIDLARGELLDLYNREGWRALGYRSWRACADAEFGGSQATLYRQLEAAQIAQSLGDSQFENLPTSQLQAVKHLPPEQGRQAIEHAHAATNGKPTAKAVREAAEQIAAPDLPPEFAIVQRRLAAHGVTLSVKDGMFVTHAEGTTGIATPTWANVTDRLDRLEQQPAERAENAAAYDAQERADLDLIELASVAIASGNYVGARSLLDRVVVATWKADHLRQTIPAEQQPQRAPLAGRRVTLEFSADECAALIRESRLFSSGELTKKLPAIGQLLIVLIEGIATKGTK